VKLLTIAECVLIVVIVVLLSLLMGEGDPLTSLTATEVYFFRRKNRVRWCVASSG